MNKKIFLSVLLFVLFSTRFDSSLTHASSDWAPSGYSKSIVASSSTVFVPDNYTTIQDAINNANEGDTIFVRAGTYYEHVVVDKALSLLGENKHNTIIDGSGNEIVVACMHACNNITLSGFTMQNGELGIFLWGSSNSNFTDNIALNNSYGIYFYYSDYNLVTGNNSTNNTQYGIYLVGSSHNTFTSNTVSLNDGQGIYLDHSGNNVFSGNVVSNNSYGFYVGDSDNNVFSGNVVSNNSYGIYFYYSDHNLVTGNNSTNNTQYGIYLVGSSSNNRIFHNNFISNAETQSSVGSLNSWDNGVEGNYWSDYGGTDANWDGIGDTPYSTGEKNKDEYPLMSTFLQFNIATRDQPYKIGVVCDSTISNLQYLYDPDSKTNVVIFKVNGTVGENFCRISIPHALTEPPYAVTVDRNPPSHFETVYTNGTHTWLYFTYNRTEHEVVIMHTLYLEQLVLFQWATFGLTVIIVVLLTVSINYYRKFHKQKKIIQAYERELESFPFSHPERARALFIKDAIKRKEKIEKFKRKYGIKIEPASTLEDLMEKLGIQKEG